jgi:hypothetical protein
MSKKPTNEHEKGEELDEAEKKEVSDVECLTVEIMELVMTALRENGYNVNDAECRQTMATLAIAPATAAVHLLAIQEASTGDGSVEMARELLKHLTGFMATELERICSNLKIVAEGARQGATETLQ